MDPRIAGFDWDRANRKKCRNHGVSIAAIESLFRGSIAVIPDLAHSAAEERFKAIGVTDGARHVLIVFTLRTRDGETFIRPISARYMHRKEVRHYEKAIAEIRDR